MVPEVKTGVGTGGQQHTKGLSLSTGGLNRLDIPGHIQALHLGKLEFSTEGLRLSPHGLGQRLAGGMLYTGIIDHFMGNGDLTAKFLLFQYQGPVLGPGQINGSCQARWAAANDNDIV